MTASRDSTKACRPEVVANHKVVGGHLRREASDAHGSSRSCHGQLADQAA